MLYHHSFVMHRLLRFLSAPLKGLLMLPGWFDFLIILDLPFVTLDLPLFFDRQVELQVIWNSVMRCVRKDLPGNDLSHISWENCPQGCHNIQHMLLSGLLIFLDSRYTYDIDLLICTTCSTRIMWQHLKVLGANGPISPMRPVTAASKFANTYMRRKHYLWTCNSTIPYNIWCYIRL